MAREIDASGRRREMGKTTARQDCVFPKCYTLEGHRLDTGARSAQEGIINSDETGLRVRPNLDVRQDSNRPRFLQRRIGIRWKPTHGRSIHWKSHRPPSTNRNSDAGLCYVTLGSTQQCRSSSWRRCRKTHFSRSHYKLGLDLDDFKNRDTTTGAPGLRYVKSQMSRSTPVVHIPTARGNAVPFLSPFGKTFVPQWNTIHRAKNRWRGLHERSKQ